MYVRMCVGFFEIDTFKVREWLVFLVFSMYWVAYIGEVITLCVYSRWLFSIFLYNIGLCYALWFLVRVVYGTPDNWVLEEGTGIFSNTAVRIPHVAVERIFEGLLFVGSSRLRNQSSNL
jgi:hypothetical protein